MLRTQDRSHRALARAVEIAIAAGDLPQAARAYGKTDLLGALADAMGLARNALRNLYYRDENRLEIVLQGYILQHDNQVAGGLQNLPFRQYLPIVWKRPQQQLKESRASLVHTVQLLQSADRLVRETPDAPIQLRREVGTVAAEVMACALTFYEGQRRWDMLREAERIFLSAMGALGHALDVDPEDAALFAKFWENRATVCGMQWSNIWDDPALPPTVDSWVVDLALRELDKAAEWARQNSLQNDAAGERLRQLLADKAKWLIKAGRFEEARDQLARLTDFTGVAASADVLLVRTLEAIATDRLADAARTGDELAGLLADADPNPSLAKVTSSILVHNIELLRERRPPVPDEIAAFLKDSPIVGSEMVNLPRYKARLTALGYAEAVAN